MKAKRIIALLLITFTSSIFISCSSSNKTQVNTPAKKVEASKGTTSDDSVKQMIDIKSIANKKSVEVEKILNKPEKSEKQKDYIIKTYMKGKVEIAYLDDIAVRITVYPKDKTPFYNDSKKQESTLNLIGIKKSDIKTEPYIENKFNVGWHDIDGLYEISVMNKEATGTKDDTVNYIYIVTNEI